jgi:hypothetical protein
MTTLLSNETEKKYTLTVTYIDEYPDFYDVLEVVRQSTIGLTDDTLHRLAYAYEGCAIVEVSSPDPRMAHVRFMLDHPERIQSQMMDLLERWYGLPLASRFSIVIKRDLSKI